MREFLRGGLTIGLCMAILTGSMTIPVHATDYSTPVPRIPNDPIDINTLSMETLYTNSSGSNWAIENNTLTYDGKEIPIDTQVYEPISSNSGVLAKKEDYTLEIQGNNIRKELVKEAYTETVDIHGNYVYGLQDEKDYNTYDFSTLISFYKYARRLNMKFSDQNILVLLKMYIPDSFTLEELRQYSCAREFIDKTGYMCNDEPFEGFNYGYISALDDTITPEANKKGYSSIEEYMDSVVRESTYGVTYWKVHPVSVWPLYFVVPRTVITQEKAEQFATTHNYKLLHNDDNWYFSSTHFYAWNDYAVFQYSKKIPEYAEELGISTRQMKCQFEEEVRNTYTTYYSFTERDAINAWADEMDTWSGHWDYFLYGNANYKYWFNSDTAIPGYYRGNWGEGMNVIVDRLEVYHEPEYKYYVTGPGDFTITLTGKNNQDGHGRANIVGTVTKTIHVVKGSGSGSTSTGNEVIYLNKGPANTWQYVSGSWYYYDAAGNPRTGWVASGNDWYYMQPNGKMSVGWTPVDGKWYYLKGDGAMATGWLKLGNNWYYLYNDGSMATGWVASGGQWYYMKNDGAMASGWIADGGKWYYLKGDGAMATGWLKLGDTWYYLTQSGAMATSWAAVGGQWYYMYGSGAMATGWIQDGDAWYYLNGSGAMARNVWVGNYYLTSSGVMATNTWIDSWYVGEDGAWVPDQEK